ncbi:alpha/beta hydrolase [Kurthia gibsonii]|uniref:alpha/beta hydrolase n=1 Tax=Kurthia gibsonii TaxID=33946 RepID=UPI00301A1D9C
MKWVKRFLKWYIGLNIILIVGLIVATEVSPKPGTAMIRYVFNREVPIKDVGNFKKSEEVVNVQKNMHYDSKYPRNTFDLYTPKDMKKGEKLPVLIWLHGGGYLAGDKSLAKEFATYVVTKERVAVISMNYELAPELRYPGQVEQVNDLYKTLVASPEKWTNFDLTKIAFGGDSAGAQIVGQYVAIQTNPTYAKEMNMKQLVPKEHLKAFISYCGPLDLQQMKDLPKKEILMKFFAKTVAWDLIGDKNWKDSSVVTQASLTEHVTSDFPPSYVTDVNGFSFLPQGQAFVKELVEQDVPVQSLFYANEEQPIYHEYQFSYDTKEAQRCLAETLAFLKVTLKD